MKNEIDCLSQPGVGLMTRNVTKSMERNVKEFRDLSIQKKSKVAKEANKYISTAFAIAPYVERAYDTEFAKKWFFDCVKISFFMGLQIVKGQAFNLPSSVVDDALKVAGLECEQKIWSYMGNENISEEEKKNKASETITLLEIFVKSNSHFFFNTVANYPNSEQLLGWLGVCYEGATRRAFASSNVNF